MNMDLASKIIELIQHVDNRIDIDESNLTPIQEFYKDTKIFVTGGTGFLGQILIEKLLRSCPVSTVYLLVRNKKGKNIDERLKETFDDQLFNRLKTVCPDFLQKLVAVEGDCALPDLGLSVHNKTLLINEVNIIFHAAATVRFNEKLKLAAAINVRAIRDLSILAQQMTKLKSFVQVSTAFSNCIHDVIEEKIYPTPLDYNKLLHITDSLDNLIVDVLEPHFVGKCPNTYIYTKQIAEDVVKRETRGLAAGIYRPAIVTSTLREPVRGWINNLHGFGGIALAATIGLLRVVYGDAKGQANLVPVDMCINGLIASAWDVAERFQDAKDENEEFEIPIYNYESVNEKPIRWNHTKVMMEKYGLVVPPSKVMWTHDLHFFKSRVLYLIATFCLHMIPAVLVDSVLLCTGKKTRMIEIYKKVHNFTSMISYFTTKNFDFKSLNVRKMLSCMSDRDRQIFFCDIKELDWDEFFATFPMGVKTYLLKDNIEDLPEARKRLKRLIWANRILKTTLGLLAALLLWFVVSFSYEILLNKVVN